MTTYETEATLSATFANRRGNAAIAVIGLANFDTISLEHGLRGRIIATAAFRERCEALTRDGDALFDIGNGQMCLLLDDLIDRNHALLAGAKLERLFATPAYLETTAIPLIARAGLVYTDVAAEHRDPHEAFRIAERNRMRAIAEGEHVHSSVWGEEPWIDASPMLENPLIEAIEGHEISLDYQPKCRLADGDVAAVEALVRWKRQGTIVPPETFVPHLSAATLWDLSRYCLRRAIRETQEVGPAIGVAVNVDSVTLAHVDLVPYLLEEVKVWDFATSRLTLEIDASSAMSRSDRLLRALEDCRRAGFRIAIEEIGTGAATLDMLRELPADEIKVSRQLTGNLLTDESDRDITQLIIDRSHGAGLEVVADGVEDATTAEYLRTIGCDYGQGFYLGAPMSARQFALSIPH